MKKMILLFAAPLLLSSSCKKKDVDNENPVIVSVSGDAVVQVGGVLNIATILKDNKQLKQLKVDIHDVFDGHGHRSFTPFSVVHIYDVSGADYTFSAGIDIPVNAATGPYHVTFRAIDDSGNQSSSKEHNFSIVNPSEQPVISISSPDFDNTVSITAGNVLSISGTVTDNVGIENIEVLLEKKSSSDTPLYDEDFIVSGATTWDFQSDGNVNISIPAGATKGGYYFVVKVKDVDGNYTIFQGEVQVN